MFVHSAVASSGVGVREMAFLRGKTLEKKMEDMTHVKNLGRSVGGVWGIGKVTRSDENPVSGTTFCMICVNKVERRVQRVQRTLRTV